MADYFQIVFDDEGVYGVAYLPSEQAVGPWFPPPGIFTLPVSGVVRGWKPLILELREGEFADYLASDMGGRICSDRLRTILEANAAPADVLQWLDIEVRRGEERQHYSILHFPEPPEVLNIQKSIVASGFVVKPVLSPVAVVSHHVFSYPNSGKTRLFISQVVKQAIETAGCTGMEIAKSPVR